MAMTKPLSEQVRFTQDGAGAVERLASEKLKELVSVKDFGAVGDGVAADTAFIVAGVLAANAGGNKRRSITITGGTYNVSQLVFSDLNDLHIHFHGVTLTGVASSPCDALLKIVNAYNLRITGTLNVDCAGNDNYENGVLLDTASGGTISPSTGILTRVSLEGLTVYSANNALRIGTKSKDAQCSEISVFGLNVIKCPSAVYIAGAQAGASFIGCNILSEPNPSLPLAPQWALIMDGGFCTIVGGELGHMVTSQNATILMRPAVSPTYSNPYPTLRISGVHIETAAQLLILSNPDALASPDSGHSEFTLTGCSGYVSGAVDALPFIDITDGTYTGTVSIKQSKFYKSAVAAVRTGANINCYGAPTSVSVDRESFGRGFRNWMAGVISGSLLHGPEVVVSASSLGGATYPAAATPLKFVLKAAGGQLDRYSENYSSLTGVFTVPPGGLKTLHISAQCAAPGLTGTIYIRLNGTIVSFGQIVDTVAHVDALLVNLNGGTTVEVILQPTSSVTFGAQASDSLEITASN